MWSDYAADIACAGAVGSIQRSASANGCTGRYCPAQYLSQMPAAAQAWAEVLQPLRLVAQHPGSRGAAQETTQKSVFSHRAAGHNRACGCGSCCGIAAG